MIYSCLPDVAPERVEGPRHRVIGGQLGKPLRVVEALEAPALGPPLVEDVTLALAAPVRLLPLEALDEVDNVEEALHELGVPVAQAAHR